MNLIPNYLETIKITKITVDPRSGATISNVIRDAIAMSALESVPVSFMFNGKQFTADVKALGESIFHQNE